MEGVVTATNIEMWDIEKVIPYENNAKRHTPDQIRNIAQQILGFGWDQPIVVQENGSIIKGHGRRLAALELGLKKVPVLVRSDLSDAEANAARISDNRVAVGEIDEDILKAELVALTEFYSMEDLGFDEGEIDLSGLLTGEVELTTSSIGTGENGAQGALQDGSATLPKEAEYTKAFQVIVECDSEAQQEEIFEQMSEQGYTCKILSL